MEAILNKINSIRKVLLKRIGNIRQRLEDAETASRNRELGELLKNAADFKKGMKEIVLTDYYSADMKEVTVRTDPKLDRFANAEVYFKSARKLEKSVPYQRKRQKETEKTLDRLQVIEDNLKKEEIPSEKAVTELKALGFGRFFKEFNKPLERKDPVDKLRTFKSSEGFTIYAGKNAVDNDYVTFRVGRGKDMWLHVSGFKGSHVVVKLPKGTECPRQTLKEAAAVALYYSKARGNFRQDVTYGPVCSVRKAARRKAGLVSIANPKYIKTDQKALETVFTNSGVTQE